MEIQLKQPYSFCQLGKRGNQEDARFPDDNMPQGLKPAFVVCDGVGGCDKGEVASRTVADAIGSYMNRVDLTLPFTVRDFAKVLDYAYSCLNSKISSKSTDMATTMTFVCFHDGGVFCAHIGDSRIYHIRPGVGIMYQSEDHSLVNALVHSGNLTPEEAIDHPRGNIITRCMGYVSRDSERPAATTLQIDDVVPGDYFFLCTDGVLHNIDDSELLAILSSDMSDREKINFIAEKSAGSTDNNTAYLIGVDSVEACDVKPDAECIDNSSVIITTPLEREMNKAVEVTADKDRSFGEKISNFFNRLF